MKQSKEEEEQENGTNGRCSRNTWMIFPWMTQLRDVDICEIDIAIEIVNKVTSTVIM